MSYVLNIRKKEYKKMMEQCKEYLKFGKCEKGLCCFNHMLKVITKIDALFASDLTDWEDKHGDTKVLISKTNGDLVSYVFPQESSVDKEAHFVVACSGVIGMTK